MKTHGLSKSRAYYRYHAMIERCYKPANKDYHNYGARGIRVCKRWLNSFQAFYDDMGEAPPGMSIDRINANGHYTPRNCRWADNNTQALNSRTTIRVTLDGEVMSVSAACRRLGREVSVPNSLREARGFTHQQAIDFLSSPDARTKWGPSCFGRLVGKRAR